MKQLSMKVAGGLVLALVLTQPAMAERGQSSYYAPPSFGDLDADRNGALDPGEVAGRTPLSGQWDRFDADRNGVIEPSEFAAFEVRQDTIEQMPHNVPLDSEPGSPVIAPNIGD